MKTIGIIGGFGPEATAQFYLKLTAKTRAPSIVQHVLVPKKLEHELLINGNSLEAFIPLLTHAAKELEKAGADFIVLPCNTLHVHEQTIRASISIPFVSIITATTKFLRKNHITRVGFLGSRITVEKNLFQKQAKNCTFITVPNVLQKQIDTGLDVFVGSQNPALLLAALNKSLKFLQKNTITDVLLACTDFGTVCPAITNMRIHDTVDMLVNATINML